jgi:hypothetical protein
MDINSVLRRYRVKMVDSVKRQSRVGEVSATEYFTRAVRIYALSHEYASTGSHGENTSLLTRFEVS